MTERAARQLPRLPDILELDAAKAEDFDALTAQLRSRYGTLDGALHAIAFAPPDALGGNFLHTPPESAEQAFRISAFSLKALAVAVAPVMDGGGSVVALDFDASVAWPAYDWMGVSKAALESVARYLARDLGRSSIRVNLISAGPVETVAAAGVDGFGRLAAAWQDRAPLGWDTQDPTPVADAACFLLSEFARGVTGEILHVDGGFHAVGAAPDPLAAAGNGRGPSSFGALR
jgi:enoyl-[acyl-carrier protein] reductase I